MDWLGIYEAVYMRTLQQALPAEAEPVGSTEEPQKRRSMILSGEGTSLGRRK